VLLGEQRVQARQAEPVVLVEARQVQAVLALIGEQASVGADLQLAVLEGPDRVLGLLIGSVDLRAVPPVGLGVAVVDRAVAVAALADAAAVGGNRHRAAYPHRVIGPVVALLHRDLQHLFGLAAAVEEPVVVLELDPRLGQHIEGLGRLELVAGQLQRDLAGAGVIQSRRLLGLDPLGVDVAGEGRARGAHLRVLQVVPLAVGSAGGERLLRRLLQSVLANRSAGVEQVQVPQIEPQRQEVERLQRGRGQLVPLAALIDLAEDRVQGAIGHDLDTGSPPSCSARLRRRHHLVSSTRAGYIESPFSGFPAV